MSEAVELLGKPESSIRRQIAQGRVTGEQVLRDPDNPRDTRLVWRVLITDSPDEPPPSVEPIESDHEPPIRQEPPRFEMALLAKLDERDATIAEMAERERAQADRIAALAAEKAKAESDAIHALEAAQIERERRLEAEAEVKRLRVRSPWKPWTW